MAVVPSGRAPFASRSRKPVCGVRRPHNFPATVPVAGGLRTTAGHRRRAGGQGETGVHQVQLGGLTDRRWPSLRDQAGRRWTRKTVSSKATVAGQRGVRQAGVAAQISQVQQPGCAGRQQLEQVRRPVQGVHPRQVTDVALEASSRYRRRTRPSRAAVFGFALGGFRVTTPRHPRRDILAGRRSFWQRWRRRARQESFGCPGKLAENGYDRNDLHAPRPTIGESMAPDHGWIFTGSWSNFANRN